MTMNTIEPFDVISRFRNEESLSVGIDLNIWTGIDGDVVVAGVIASQLDGDQQQVELH